MHVTNEQFLRTVFKSDYARAWVTGFKKSPDLIQNKGPWAGGEYRNGGLEKILNPYDKNTFFTISVFNAHEGNVKRRKSLFDKCYLIMLDDIEAKTPGGELELVYGLKPSYKIETSPGNQQWGLVLTAPESRRWAVEQLQNGLVALELVVGDMKSVTRYARLPEGCNTKTKYLKKLGHAFKHRLLEWNPDQTYTVDELADLFGIELIEPETQQIDVTIDPDQPDLILQALAEEGLLKGPLPGKPGGYDVLCPWRDEHSDGDHTGSAYFTRGYRNGSDYYPFGAYVCHHSHDYALADLRRWLIEQGHTEIQEQIIDYYFDESTEHTVDTEFEAEADDTDVNDDDADPLAEYRITNWLHLKPKPRKWLFKNTVPLGKAGLLIAPGGTGKTFFTVNAILSIASGEPLGGCEQLKPEAPGCVLAYFAEEDIEELQRRLYYTADELSMFGINENYDLRTLEKRIFIKSTLSKDWLLTKTGNNARALITKRVRQIIATAKCIKHLRLIIFDPLSHFSGGSENSNEDAAVFMRALSTIARQTGATVMVPHHSNKNGIRSETVSQSDGRGASNFTDGARWQLHLSKMRVDQAANYQIPEDECKRYVALHNCKANYAPETDLTWFKRNENGVLRHAKLQALDEDHLINVLTCLKALKDLIIREEGHGRYLTQKRIRDDFAGRDGPLNASQRLVRETMQYGLDQDELKLERPPKTMQGVREIITVNEGY